MRVEPYRLAVMAFLAAISIILTRFFSFLIAGNTIRIAFDHTPIYLAGIILGPFGGALTGIVSDLAGVLILPVGGFFPGFTLSYALIGIIPGLFFRNCDFSHISRGRLVGSLLFTDILVSLVLNTFWLSIMIGDAYIALLPSRLVARGIIMPVQIFFVYYLLRYTPALNLKKLKG